MSVASKGARTTAVAIVCALGLLACATSALAAEAKFTYTGKEQQFKVPAGVSSVNVVAIGSQGGSNTSATAAGGVGAIVNGTLSVKPEQLLYIEVGGVSFNGGGSHVPGGGFGFFGNGGGASDVRTVSIGAEPSPGGKASLQSRLLVAAGGGGGGFTSFAGSNLICLGGVGGAAGEKGANGNNCGFTPGEGGGAGEQSKGGGGGLTYYETTALPGLNAEAGRLGVGGRSVQGFGGGGGGGLYGGGGGGEQVYESGKPVIGLTTAGEGGGGGGSDLVPTGGEAKLASTGQATSVTITYTALPSSKEQCKHEGWKNFGTTFKNQGQCVSFVANGGTRGS